MNVNEYDYRKVWEEKNGKIPDGYLIHHIDGDRTNNHVDNLIPLTPQDHRRLHTGWSLIDGKVIKDNKTFAIHSTLTESDYNDLERLAIDFSIESGKTVKVSELIRFIIRETLQKNLLLPGQYKKYKHNKKRGV